MLTLLPRMVFHLIVMHFIVSKWYLQICERSLTSSTGGPAGPPTTSFVRAEVLPSGYLIRPCEGGGSIIHIVDHVDLDVRIRADWIHFSYNFVFLFICLFEFLVDLGMECSWSSQTTLWIIKDSCSENDCRCKNYCKWSFFIDLVNLFFSHFVLVFLLHRPCDT